MAVEFQFTALGPTGEQQAGTCVAPDRASAIQELEKRGLSVLECTPTAAAGQRTPPASREFFGIPPRQVTYFTRQFAYLLDSGVLLMESLYFLRTYTTSPGLRKVLGNLHVKIQEGNRLSDAMAAHPVVFSPLYCSMVRVGESTGTLPKAVGRLADYLDQEMELRGRLKAAATYPLLVLVFSVLLVYGMLVFLLPGFLPMFEGAGVDLDKYPLTKFLMAASRVATDPWAIGFLVGLGLGGAALWPAASRNRTLQRGLDRLAWRLPILGGVVQMLEIARTNQTLAAVLDSGVTLTQGLGLAAEAGSNVVVSEALAAVKLRIEAGDDLVEAFAEAGVFPPLMVQMVGAGQATGNLPGMLAKVAGYFDFESRQAVSALTSLLEPLLMVGVGGVVTVFILGILLPLFGLITSLNA